MPETSDNTDFVPPSWMNFSFLETVLRSEENDGRIEVTSSTIKPATASGDNYLSEIFRVVVQFRKEGQNEEKSLIVKIEPNKEDMFKIVSDGYLFDVETFALSDVLPKMHRLLEEKAPGKYHPFGPKYLYSNKGPPATVIVLEDLKVLGFRMTEQTLGLDSDHCFSVVKNLARYHGTSLALYERNPQILKPFMRTLFCDKMRNNLETFFTSNIKKLAEEVDTWMEYKDRFAQKVHKIADKAMDYWFEALERHDDEFNVLTHGDLWINNIMFRYSEETKELHDMRFVDFQFTYWGSPTIDLIYFLHTSTAIDIPDKYLVFVEEYHKTLGETLAIFGLEHLHPSLEHLNQQLEKRGTFAAISCMTVRTVMVDNRNDVPDMDNLLKEEDGVHLSEIYKNAMKNLLPFYEQKGWLG